VAERRLRKASSRPISRARVGQLLAQDPRSGDQVLRFLLRVLEALDVGDDLRCLQREDEPVRNLIRPPPEQGPVRHAIEGVVYLNRVEVPRIEGEHLSCGDALGIERALPLSIPIPACPDI